MMKESEFQSKLKKKLQARFPDAVVRKEDPTFSQGFPDLLILFSNGKYANLECKREANAHHQPNQDIWVDKLDKMSYARFIYPENEKEVLTEMEEKFGMQWYDHPKLKGQHAWLGGSNYHWLNYDHDKAVTVYQNLLAKENGTKLHDIASQLINLGIRLPNLKKTLNMFVNDAIALGMRSEQTLYYSPNCFGTADAISFSDGYLRIHDLKTGNVKAHMEQLKIYAALFFLEYKYNPEEVTTICSIYQNDEVIVETMTADEIKEVMAKIIDMDILLKDLKENNTDEI